MLCPRPRACDITLVSDLILQDKKCWDREVVVHTFIPMDANVILATPLTIKSLQDFFYLAFREKC